MARFEGPGAGTTENLSELEKLQTVEIQKSFISASKSTYLDIADISSAISQPISTKFGVVNMLGSVGVVAEPEFKFSYLLPWRIGNADFKAPFVRETARLCHRFPSE